MEKPKRIQMQVALAGDAISYAPDQILVVGEEISEELAIALCLEGERAIPLEGWQPKWGDARDDPREEPAPEPVQPELPDTGGSGLTTSSFTSSFSEADERVAAEQAGEAMTAEERIAAAQAEAEATEERVAAEQAAEAEAAEAEAGEPQNDGSPVQETHMVGEEAEEEEKREEPVAETATSPAADQRETTDVKKTRRGGRRKPPVTPPAS